jgi:sulfite reductase beta subunit-like hemoprotein
MVPRCVASDGGGRWPLVRVKPYLGRMTADRLHSLCGLAMTYGNGMIDLSRRANFQIRGVRSGLARFAA